MTPEQEEEVRRALAAAANDRAPMPPDVAGRLDDVLADLVAARQREPLGEAAGAAGERGARRWPRVLVAAAVVCLVALGSLTVRRSVTSGDTDATSSATAPTTSAGPPATADKRGGSGDDTASGASAAPSAGSSRGLGQEVLPAPRLHRATLPQDLRRVVAAVPLSESGRTPLARRPDSTTACRTPSAGRDADVVAVLLDGQPATLVLEAPRNGTRQALVYACADVSAPVATTHVRVP